MSRVNDLLMGWDFCYLRADSKLCCCLVKLIYALMDDASSNEMPIEWSFACSWFCRKLRQSDEKWSWCSVMTTGLEFYGRKRIFKIIHWKFKSICIKIFVPLTASLATKGLSWNRRKSDFSRVPTITWIRRGNLEFPSHIRSFLSSISRQAKTRLKLRRFRINSLRFRENFENSKCKSSSLLNEVTRIWT